MKKIILLILSFIIVSNITTFAEDISSNEVNVVIDGEEVTLIDKEQQLKLPSFIYNNRTMLPLRSVVNAFGLSDDQIIWVEESKSIQLITNSNKNIIMQIGSREILFEDQVLVADAPPIIYRNRTYIPLSALSNLLNVYPTWNAETRTVTLNPSVYKLNRFLVNIHYPVENKYVLTDDFLTDQVYRFTKLNLETNIVKSNLVIQLDNDDVSAVFNKYIYANNLSSDDFNIVSNNRISLYRKYEQYGISFVEVAAGTLVIETYNIELEELKEIIDSLEEVAK